ncbi:MAG: hypothetical protein K2G40_02185 [Muribaculaceae bacterium]|nr:hypothetical protein [Muribaculaceae bacterium]
MKFSRLATYIPLYVIAIIAIATGCQSTPAPREVPVPRPEAYFRLEIPDTVYYPSLLGGEIIMLNSAIDSVETVSIGRNSWLTASYPGGRATIYLTITEIDASTEAEVMENRTERMSLNTGGNQCFIENSRTGKGRTATLLITPAGSPTPVQLMIHGHGDKIITVAANCEEAATARPDSIQPVVEMLVRDINYMATKL